MNGDRALAPKRSNPDDYDINETGPGETKQTRYSDAAVRKTHEVEVTTQGIRYSIIFYCSSGYEGASTSDTDMLIPTFMFWVSFLPVPE